MYLVYSLNEPSIFTNRYINKKIILELDNDVSNAVHNIVKFITTIYSLHYTL